MYEVTIAMEEKGRYEEFSDAFKAFYDEVTIQVRAKQLNWHLFETTCWIECTGTIDGEEVAVPILFDELKLLGHRLGYLVDGKLAETLPKRSPHAIFAQAQILNLDRRFLEILSILQASLPV